MSREYNTFWDILLALAYQKGYTATAICEKLGLSRAYIAKGKATNTIPKIDTAIRLLGACDYALVAVPKEVQLPHGAIVIDTPIDKDNSSK